MKRVMRAQGHLRVPVLWCIQGYMPPYQSNVGGIRAICLPTSPYGYTGLYASLPVYNGVYHPGMPLRVYNRGNLPGYASQVYNRVYNPGMPLRVYNGVYTTRVCLSGVQWCICHPGMPLGCVTVVYMPVSLRYNRVYMPVSLR